MIGGGKVDILYYEQYRSSYDLSVQATPNGLVESRNTFPHEMLVADLGIVPLAGHPFVYICMARQTMLCTSNEVLGSTPSPSNGRAASRIIVQKAL